MKQGKIHITSLDKFLKMFGIVYDPDLPEPESFHEYRFLRPVSPCLALTKEHGNMPVDVTVNHFEEYRKDQICFQDADGKNCRLLIWRRVR